MGWYTEGTVNVVNGSQTVTGVGNLFIENSRVGDGFRGPDGELYEVINIPSDTSLAIRPAYAGPTLNGGAFSIAPLQGYVKLSADRLREITLGLRNIDGDVATSQANAAAALASKNAAHASELAAGLSEVAAGQHEDAAQASEDAAGQYAQQALDSQNAAGASEGEALASQNAAAASAQTATEKEAAATASAGVASAKEASATDAAVSATASQNAAEASASDAHADALQVAADKDTVTTAAAQVATDKPIILAARDETLTARDEAVAAAGSLTGSLTDQGYIDLSGGTYPAETVTSSFWKVTVPGTVSGTDYGIGDTLVYSKTVDVFYKIDNTESVSSVGGFTGAVSKAQLAIDLVDNTPDASKPISTAQAAAFAARTPTVGTLDQTAGRLVKVGDYGMNGGPTLGQSGAIDANNLTVPGRYNFTSGGVNLPSGVTACYIDVIGYVTAGYCKQLLYGFSTNVGCYERYQSSGSWSAWAPVGTTVEVVDNLTSTDPAKALSAKQGKALKDLIDAAASGSATLTRYTYNLSAGQTVITGTDLNGHTLAYTVGVALLLDKDGFPLWIDNDYTATNGSTITLTTAAESDCQINILVFGNFLVSDTYTKAEVDAKAGFGAAYIGSTIAWKLPESTIPGGLLPENGQLVNRATYPDLWAKVSASAVSDATWLAAPYLDRGKFSTGDGSTTFRMPDTNAKHADNNTPSAAFLRGYGKNSAGTPGLFQLDQFQGFRMGDSGGFSISSYTTNYAAATTASDATRRGAYATKLNAAPDLQLGPITDGVNGTPRFGTETRGPNVTVIWCTVAANNATNLGSVDVMALAGNVTALGNRTSVLEAVSPLLVLTIDGTATPPTIVAQQGRVLAASVSRSSAGIYSINFAAPIASAVAKIVGLSSFTTQLSQTYGIVINYGTSTTSRIDITSFLYATGNGSNQPVITVAIYVLP